jgi:lipoprotein signal peptidase
MMDQLTKYVAENNLMVWQDGNDLKLYQGKRIPMFSLGAISEDPQQPTPYLSFSFNYVRNQGAAWGMLSEWDDRYREPFFYLVTFMAVVFLLYLLRTTPTNHFLLRFAFTLVLSGAIGNFLDRLSRGYVVDFLDFRWIIPFGTTIDLAFWQYSFKANAWYYSFPNFNWADSAITVGLFCIFLDMIFFEKLRKHREGVDSRLG